MLRGRRTQVRERRGGTRDDPTPARLVAGTAALGWLVVLAALLAWLGVGGWRAGWAWVATLLSGGAALIVWSGFERVRGRVVWTATAVLLGIALTPAVVDASPLSRGRLRDLLGDARPERYALVADVGAGHGWCSPTCPVVTRTYEAPDQTRRTVVRTLAAALAEEGLAPEPGLLTDDELDSGFSHRSGDVTVVVRIQEAPEGPPLAVVSLASSR